MTGSRVARTAPRPEVAGAAPLAILVSVLVAYIGGAALGAAAVSAFGGPARGDGGADGDRGGARRRDRGLTAARSGGPSSETGPRSGFAHGVKREHGPFAATKGSVHAAADRERHGRDPPDRRHRRAPRGCRRPHRRRRRARQPCDRGGPDARGGRSGRRGPRRPRLPRFGDRPAPRRADASTAGVDERGRVSFQLEAQPAVRIGRRLRHRRWYPRHSTRASGGIGRRAGFRCLCPKGCGGSSPPSPTNHRLTEVPNGTRSTRRQGGCSAVRVSALAGPESHVERPCTATLANWGSRRRCSGVTDNVSSRDRDSLGIAWAAACRFAPQVCVAGSLPHGHGS